MLNILISLSPLSRSLSFHIPYPTLCLPLFHLLFIIIIFVSVHLTVCFCFRFPFASVCKLLQHKKPFGKSYTVEPLFDTYTNTYKNLMKYTFQSIFIIRLLDNEHVKSIRWRRKWRERKSVWATRILDPRETGLKIWIEILLLFLSSLWLCVFFSRIRARSHFDLVNWREWKKRSQKKVKTVTRQKKAQRGEKVRERVRERKEKERTFQMSEPTHNLWSMTLEILVRHMEFETLSAFSSLMETLKVILSHF